MTEAKSPLKPREIVERLDRYIVGQADAKRAVAVAMRNRWRRQQLSEEMRNEVSPKNILMIGSTGVGKTEIARRLAKLTGSPFIKVEATKYTEVGYYGRDVESMVRELVDNAITIVRSGEQERLKPEADKKTEDRLVELLCPAGYQFGGSLSDAMKPEPDESMERTREKMRQMLIDGDLEDRMVEVRVEQKAAPMMIGGMGMDQMDGDFQGMLEKLMPKSQSKREVKVSDARKIIFEQQCDAMMDEEKVNAVAIELAENEGMIFLDEIDKVIASESKSTDVSRSGVQRDLLPIVEGTSVKTRHGYIRTDHILFVAAGAFHKNQPSDLMPELQGRFPIRVELNDLTEDDFVRILTEPTNSLTRQYAALLETEGVTLDFAEDGVRELARIATRVNETTINIGARRLYTILEHLLEELSFEAPDMSTGAVTINEGYVNERLGKVVEDEDLSRYIL
jgi:ATP-dependent HslUV protease ATP-binding subunit HslU